LKNQSAFQIYSLSHCPYCLRAKQLLNQEGLQFHETVIADDDINGRSELFNRTGMKTFPQIFFKDEVIGGFSDLKNIFDQNGFEQFRKNQ
tara:strand:- start:58433 stop:58702 length:270 start_codon:yes stop_codon:yes gene_type:complete